MCLLSSWFYDPLHLRSASFSRDPRTWPPGAYIRSHFGQQVLWHANDDHASAEGEGGGGRHLTAEQLEPYRHVGDPLVDDIFVCRRQEGNPVRAGEDLVALAATARPESPLASERALYKFYQTYSTFPSSWFADKSILSQGQDVFLAYLPAISMSLYYRSLVPGFSIPRIAVVLASTGYLAPPASRDHVRNRLMDTGLFLLKCFGTNVDDLFPGGEAWKCALYVRTLHAKVRHGLLQRRKGASRAWDTARLGIPINQEDMAATLMAFAINPLLGTEMLLGSPVPKSDVLAYLAVWRYIGWLLGIPVDEEWKSFVVDKKKNSLDKDKSTDKQQQQQQQSNLRPLDPCGNGWIADRPDPIQHAYAVFQSIVLHLMEPDEVSVKIANHLLWQGRVKDAQPAQRAQEERWYYFRALQCRRFIGDPLADALQLPLRPTRFGRCKQYLVSNMYLFLLTVYSWLGVPWSPVRSVLVAWHRRQLRKVCESFESGHRQRVHETLVSQDPTLQGTTCPFAMISPPIY